MKRNQVVADAEVARNFPKNLEGTATELDPNLESPADWPNIEQPEDFMTWNKKKQLIFEHKCLNRLQKYFKDTKYDVKRGKILDSFI